jgi:hypothetical protein
MSDLNTRLTAQIKLRELRRGAMAGVLVPAPPPHHFQGAINTATSSVRQGVERTIAVSW